MAPRIAPKRAVFDSLVKLGKDAATNQLHELTGVYISSILRLGNELGVLRPDGSLPRK